MQKRTPLLIQAIVYDTPAPLPLNFIFAIKNSLEESNLPIKVDLVDMNDIAQSYREGVLRERVEV